MALTVDLLNQPLAARDEQRALGQLLDRPRQEAVPAVHLAALARELVDAAQGHVGHEQRAARTEARVAELTVDGALLARRQLKLAHDARRGNLHDDTLGRAAVLDEHHVATAYGLYGVNLGALGGGILPDGLALLRHLGDAILVGQQDVSIFHQHGVADLALVQPVLIGPADLSVLDDEHAALLALPGVEEVVAGERLVDVLRCQSHCRQQHDCYSCQFPNHVINNSYSFNMFYIRRRFFFLINPENNLNTSQY